MYLRFIQLSSYIFSALEGAAAAFFSSMILYCFEVHTIQVHEISKAAAQPGQDTKPYLVSKDSVRRHSTRNPCQYPLIQRSRMQHLALQDRCQAPPRFRHRGYLQQSQACRFRSRDRARFDLRCHQIRTRRCKPFVRPSGRMCYDMRTIKKKAHEATKCAMFARQHEGTELSCAVTVHPVCTPSECAHQIDAETPCVRRREIHVLLYQVPLFTKGQRKRSNEQQHAAGQQAAVVTPQTDRLASIYTSTNVIIICSWANAR